MTLNEVIKITTFKSDVNCPICGSYLMTPLHVCPPTWEVCREDERDEFSDTGYPKVFAADVREAAERYASRHFADWDYPSNVRIVVDPGTDIEMVFLVDVRQEPVFEATRVNK